MPLTPERLAAGTSLRVTGGERAAALAATWHAALTDVAACVRPLPGSPAGADGGAPTEPLTEPLTAALTEGGPYPGCWLESTGSISTEVLGRFAPGVARDTHLLLARGARDDGLLPYKVTDDGPAHAQIQRVTPLARSVWEQYLRTGSGPGDSGAGNRDTDYLREMYAALAADDAWVAEHRDTRGTGGVEAFCTYDTGHDASPRFWHVPDTCPDGDPACFDAAHPLLPFVAPDLTAEAYARRVHLARAAEDLGEDPRPWRTAASDSLAALDRLWHAGDETWYDRDATGEPVRIRTDVLLRVLACGVGDDALFDRLLRRHLLSTRGFLAPAGFTSVALDDPRFDRDATRNSWGGPVNFLALLRAPRAFEAHGRTAELARALRGAFDALLRADRFPQTLDPWTGDAGYGSGYSPAALFFLDAVERFFGVLELPDGGVLCTGLSAADPGRWPGVESLTYERPTRSGVWAQTVAGDRVAVTRDGSPWLAFPVGWRVELAPSGEVVAVTGVSGRPVAGTLTLPDGTRTDLTLAPNERVAPR
ncbi:hypothetical protein [Promicromonospora sp. MEB111]|uniref:MGH1-like glycoside hydrolase domain-containing protein n=1 Tax=Promicromonospora sp. MEB111 TaxID=3040301 RepID=UPI002551350B|nr:hypothetical protein [Promicromonospora sp. MEB111]